MAVGVHIDNFTNSTIKRRSVRVNSTCEIGDSSVCIEMQHTKKNPVVNNGKDKVF